MVKQFIELGKGGWYIIVYYGVNKNSKDDIIQMLVDLDCPKKDIRKSLKVLMRSKNTGLTFTNSEYKTSFVCIRETTSEELFVNTVVHESKHILSHICAYYDIEEDSERAAYLIGYIVQRMYRKLRLLR